MENFQTTLPSSSDESSFIINALNVNLDYQYTCDDILLALQARLKEKGYHWDINRKMLAESVRGCHICVLTPVDALAQQSTPLVGFLDKKKQPSNSLSSYLTQIFPYLNTLENIKEERIACHEIKRIIGDNVDEAIYQILLTKLQEHRFDLAALQHEVARLEADARHDVFDEIMPLFRNELNAKAKILFAYNTTYRDANNFINNLVVEGHWLTGEIELNKIANSYQVIITAHNPYRGGRIEASDELKTSIEERIHAFYDNEPINIRFAWPESPFKTTRQDDGASCGVIVVEELIERIEGKALDTIYKPGCQEERESQYQAMTDYIKSHTLDISLEQFLQKEVAPKILDIGYTDLSNERAIALLDIDEARLKNLPTSERRKRYIEYKTFLSEFYYSKAAKTYGFDEETILTRIDALSQQVMALTDTYPTRNTSHCVGLWDLDTRPIYKKTGHESLLTLGDKNKGAEPGFFAVLQEDIVIELKEHHPNRKQRLDFFQRQYSDFERDIYLMFLLPEDLSTYQGHYIFLKGNKPQLIFIDYDGHHIDININDFNMFITGLEQLKGLNDVTKLTLNPEQFKALITSNGGHRIDFGFFKAIYDLYADKMPKYLVKQDYSLVSLGRVAPAKKDLKRTKAIQDAFKTNKVWGNLRLSVYQQYKTGSPLEKNIEAVLEVLANDLARLSGMDVQEQALIKASYENGRLKFLLKSIWEMNASELSPLAGGGIDSYHNYRVKPTLWQPDNICYLINDSIPDLASYFATFLIQNDYDAIGSTGGNKLEQNHALFGIDFGHAYRGKNTLIQSLLPNLHLPEQLLNKYKNFSIFYQAKRSELIKGILIYAKLIGRDIEEVLKQYDANFREKMNRIEQHGIERLFNDYVETFKTLAKNEPAHKKEYQVIADKIEATRNVMTNAIQELLNKVDDKIRLSPQLNDLIECLEKVSMGPSQTSLRSSDETVLLNHLRIIDEAKYTPWAMAKTNEGYQFHAVFKNREAAEQARRYLQQFPHNHSIKYRVNKTQLSFVCKEQDINDLCYRYNENNIKQTFHPQDYQRYQRLIKEKKLAEWVDGFSKDFKSYQVSLTFSNLAQPSYTLIIKKGQPFNLSEIECLSKFMQFNEDRSSAFILAFSHERINELLGALNGLKRQLTLLDIEGVPDEVERVESNREEEEVISILSDKEAVRQGALDAIKNNDLEGVKAYILLVHAVDKPLDEKGNTLLHHALIESKPQIVNFLSAKVKADAMIKNNEGKTATALALSKSQADYFETIEKHLPNASILEAKNEEMDRWVDELSRMIKYQGHLSDIERRQFIGFWKTLCSIDNSNHIKLIHPSKLATLRQYYSGPTNTLSMTKTQIEFFGKVNKLLTYDNARMKSWALERVNEISKSKQGKTYTDASIDEAKTYLASYLGTLTKKQDQTIAKIKHQTTDSYRIGRGKIDVWNESTKAALKRDWMAWTQKAGILEPLQVDIVFQVIASRILLSSNNSHYGDAQMDSLLSEAVDYYSFLQEGNEKNDWKYILQGLLVLGANPLATLNHLLNPSSFDETISTSIEPSSLDSIYAMSRFSEIILTHLKHRADHLDICIKEVDDTFSRLIEANNNFGKALYHAVFKPGLLPWFAATILKRDPNDARCERALFFGSVMQLIYKLLNSNLNEAICPQDELSSKHVHSSDLSSLDKLRKQLVQYRNSCEQSLEKGTLFDNRGTSEFKALVRAVNEVDEALSGYKEKREEKTMAFEYVELKESSDIIAQSAETKAKKEAEKRQEAEVRAEKVAQQLDSTIQLVLKKKLKKYLNTHSDNFDKQELKDICVKVAKDLEKSIGYIYAQLESLIQREPEFEMLRMLSKSILRESVGENPHRFFFSESTRANQGQEATPHSTI